jgi:hypothetical protein
MTPVMTEDEYGVRRWKLSGELHREDGPAIQWSNGYGHWYLNGHRHRADGPAIEWTADSYQIEAPKHKKLGNKFWYFHGGFHRTDGPAIEWDDGRREWYLNNVFLKLEDWLDQTTGLTDEEKVMYKLTHV